MLTPNEVAGVCYLALTQHLSRTSQFADSRRAVVTSARTLFRKLTRATRDRKLADDRAGLRRRRHPRRLTASGMLNS